MGRYGKNFIILTSTVFVWSTRLTDGWITYTRYSIYAVAHKNQTAFIVSKKTLCWKLLGCSNACVCKLQHVDRKISPVYVTWFRHGRNNISKWECVRLQLMHIFIANLIIISQEMLEPGHTCPCTLYHVVWTTKIAQSPADEVWVNVAKREGPISCSLFTHSVLLCDTLSSTIN